MNDPYRTTAADAKPLPALRPYRILNVSWEDNEDWEEQIELGLLELYQAGYEVVTMTDGGGCLTALLKLRQWT
jgi:hypothetical protein